MAAISLAVLAAGCTGEPSALPSPPVREIAAGTPAPSPSVTPPSAERDWSLNLEKVGDDGQDEWRNGGIHRYGDRYVAVGEELLVGISGKGKRTWKRRFEGDIRFRAEIAEGAVVVQYPHPDGGDWPGRYVYAGIDPANGKTIWEATGAPYGSTAGDITLVPVCRGEQTEAMDDCQVTAREVRTGAIRWTIPTEHVPKVEAYGDGVLALTTRPKGYRGKHWLTTYDAQTGARLGVRAELETYGGELLYPKGQDRVSGPTFMTGDRIVLTSEDDSKYPEKCELRMVALNVRTGARDWKKDLSTGDPEDDCESAWSSDSGRYAVARTGKDEPIVFDLAKKERRWTGPKDTSIVATDGKVALVRGEAGLGLYDLGSDEKRWDDRQAPFGPEADAEIQGDRVLVYDQQCSSKCHVRFYDLDKGLLDSSARGTFAGSGKGWVATREDSRFSVTSVP